LIEPEDVTCNIHLDPDLERKGENWKIGVAVVSDEVDVAM
jgi:hypothetical protein